MFENSQKVDASKSTFNDVRGNQTNITNNHFSGGSLKDEQATVNLILWHNLLLAELLAILVDVTRETDMACPYNSRSSRGYRLKFDRILEHKIKAWRNLECLNALNELPSSSCSATDKASVNASMAGGADTGGDFIAKGAPLVSPL